MEKETKSWFVYGDSGMDKICANMVNYCNAENTRHIVFFVVIALLVLLVLFNLFGSVFSLSAARENMAIQNGIVADQGDRLVWLGMDIIPLSGSLWKELSIPSKCKGMFVLEAGNLAGPVGIQEGDVICAVNQRKTSDRKSFLKTANDIQYYDGVLLDLYRKGRKLFVTVPIFYSYGPLSGPYKGQWQLGSPLMSPVLPYGPLLGNP